MNIAALMRRGGEVAEALARGVRDALRMHKALGLPVVACREQQLVLLSPEQIRAAPDATKQAPASPPRRRRAS